MNTWEVLLNTATISSSMKEGEVLDQSVLINYGVFIHYD